MSLRWLTLLGIIIIVLASCGLLCGKVAARVREMRSKQRYLLQLLWFGPDLSVHQRVYCRPIFALAGFYQTIAPRLWAKLST